MILNGLQNLPKGFKLSLYAHKLIVVSKVRVKLVAGASSSCSDVIRFSFGTELTITDNSFNIQSVVCRALRHVLERKYSSVP
jgi:hypothetical protein